MGRASILVIAALGGGCTILGARDARALGPFDVEIGAKAGWGSNPFQPDPNRLGFGLGGRIGASLFNVYAGLEWMRYFGASTEDPNGTFSAHTVKLGYAMGYGFKVADIVTIRPLLGLGGATVTEDYVRRVIPSNEGAGGVEGPRTYVYAEPGVTTLVTLGPIYVGADANVMWLPRGDQAAFTANGEVGVKL